MAYDAEARHRRYVKHQDRERARDKAYRAARKPQARERHLLKQYGITTAQWDALRNEQGDRCAVCGGPLGIGRTDTDHDPKTGKVRGLTHDFCNRLVGFAEHPLMPFVDAYLRRHGRQ